MSASPLLLPDGTAVNTIPVLLPGAAALCAGGEGVVWNADAPDGLAATEAFAAYFGVTAAETVRVPQKHTARVKTVTRENAGEGVTRPSSETACDGMITNVPRLVLCTFQADCVPVFLCDPVRCAVGMLHSGRKGTALAIAAAALARMRDEYGADPADAFAALGPCICADCYEVGGEVLPDFADAFTREEIASFARPRGDGKYSLDLPAAIRITLLRAGLRPDRIAPPPLCTCHTARFPSYRRNGTARRMITGVCLTPGDER